MDVLAQSSLLVAILSFAVGSAVLARDTRNKLFLSFALLTTLISGWALFFFLSSVYGYERLYRAHLAMNIWLGPAGLVFIRLLVKSQDRASHCLGRLSSVLAGLLSLALLFHGEQVPWVLQLIYFFPAVVFLQILQLVWIDHEVRRGAHKPLSAAAVALDQRTLIYLGGLLVLGTSVMDHVPWMGKAIPSFGNLALTAYLFLLGQAISQKKFLNLEALFSRFLVLLALALTLTLVYSLLFAWIENRPALFFLNSFIVSFLLILLLEPIRTLVSYLTQWLLTPKQRRLEQLLREAKRGLAITTDPERLFDAVVATASLALQPEGAALYVLRPDATWFRRVRSAGRIDGAPAEIVATHPLVEHCLALEQKGKLPVLLDQLLEDEQARTASSKQKEVFAGLLEALVALDCNLVIPLLDGPSRLRRGSVLGLLTLRIPAPPEPWGRNWGLLSILYPYFELAAGAIRGLEVFVRQREKERLAALGEMAAGLAHEIRNPLGAIRGAAQLLQPELPGSPPGAAGSDSPFLRIIVEEVDRLNRVVAEFLDYSRPRPTELSPTDLTRLVERTVDLMQPAVPPAVELSFEPASRKVSVLASAEQLRQVLINLIQNGVRAVESAKGIKRAIRVRMEAEGGVDGGHVVVHVEDSGSGIRPEHLDKLFIPFFTTSPGGTGLGLSISQKIIEAHRGRIEVATEVGKFTRFSVVLPLAGPYEGARA